MTPGVVFLASEDAPTGVVLTGLAMTAGDNPIPCAQFYARVGKRMISLLTTGILAGTLYDIDLRLRLEDWKPLP